jgi:hypothetical protein
MKDPRAARLMRLYGITLKQYDDLLDKQLGLCAICDRKPGGRRLDVDHDHRTGEIRGLLCHLCNRALGMFRGELFQIVDNLRATIHYLEKRHTGLFVPKRPKRRKKKS